MEVGGEKSRLQFRSTGAGWSKISGRRGRPHRPFLSEN